MKSLCEKYRPATLSDLRGQTWQQWSEAIWDALAAKMPAQSVMLCWLEQKQFKSIAEKRCANCGEPGTVKRESHLIKSTKHYWFCQACEDYWALKN